MKQNLLGSEYEQIAKEQFVHLIGSVPFVSHIEIINTGSQRDFGDFHAIVHYADCDQPQKFCVEVKSNGERRFVNMFMLTASQHADDSCYVFMAPYISESSAQALVEKHYSYMDLSGNCYILSKRILISNKGNPNQYVDKGIGRNYFSKSSGAASAILRTMLESPGAYWQVKMLSEISGTAVGTVSNVKRFLADRDLIEEFPQGYKLKNIKELLHIWAKDYHQREARTIQCYSFDRIPELEKSISNWNKTHGNSCLLGGFAAAVRYAPTVRYNKLSVYVGSQSVKAFIEDLDLKTVDTGGNVIVTVPHDKTPLMFAREINGDLVTSPVQTVLDLLGSAGRGEEAADAIISKEFKE